MFLCPVLLVKDCLELSFRVSEKSAPRKIVKYLSSLHFIISVENRFKKSILNHDLSSTLILSVRTNFRMFLIDKYRNGEKINFKELTLETTKTFLRSWIKSRNCIWKLKALAKILLEDLQEAKCLVLVHYTKSVKFFAIDLDWWMKSIRGNYYWLKLKAVHRFFCRPVGCKITPLVFDVHFWGKKKKRTRVSLVSQYLVGSLCGRNMPKQTQKVDRWGRAVGR